MKKSKAIPASAHSGAKKKLEQAIRILKSVVAHEKMGMKMTRKAHGSKKT